MYNWIKNKLVKTEYIKVLSKVEREKLAQQWKTYGKMNRILEKYVLVTAISKLVKREGDKEIVEAVVKMQNDLMEGFMIERIAKAKISNK